MANEKKSHTAYMQILPKKIARLFADFDVK
jgi:hypothetical protein